MTITPVREDLPEMPVRIAKLGVHRGYPVPWFCHWENGEPDFRIVGPGKAAEAWGFRRCWICGEGLGANVVYTVGPMCAINRVSSEPPSHLECAVWAVKACPFLTRPYMRRRENDIPEGAEEAAGVMLKHNPGACLIWSTRRGDTSARRVTGGGVLFDIGVPQETLWFTEGREATRSEVMEAIERGLPILREMAERDGPIAMKQFERRLAELKPLLPVS